MSLALSPAVTSYSAPVTRLAASEARNTATGEMSSGCNQPTRSGTVGGANVPRLLRCRIFHRRPASFADGFGEPLLVAGQWRIDQSRNDCVDCDVMLAELHCR